MNKLRAMTAHNNLHGLLFQATSAEYVTLCVQTYQLARHAILNRLQGQTFRNPAVVLDLDETVLDNSPYQAWLVANGFNFHEKTSWRRWCNCGSARSVPGAADFVHFAAGLQVTPVFITSRENVTRSATASNLAKLGLMSVEELGREQVFPLPDDHAMNTRLFMKGMAPVAVSGPDGVQSYSLKSKFDQRIFCERLRGFEIILSIGDNLSDYAEYYGRVLGADGEPTQNQHPLSKSRRIAAWQDQRLFGRDFILLPNPTYGGWLRALEANNLGAGDELADTSEQVRESLQEPQEPYKYENDTKIASPKGPKLNEEVRVWDGAETPPG